jgi:redox-sensitive bicupin YhaK (pirin superfamily)
VGDGFPVRTLFSYDRLGRQLSPFLLLDHAGPMDFEPASKPRGVGEHPHRGFETVTIVYDGEVDHRDSSGGGGSIGPGDVQWMTAGSGLMHEEFHSPAFTQRGGRMDMAQLWVNLPARHKMTAPRYQTILSRDIPVVELPGAAGTLRVVAGTHGTAKGPAQTFTEINVWDIRLAPNARVELPVPAGHNGVVALLGGELDVGGGQKLQGEGLALFGPAGDAITLGAVAESRLLVLSGEPINEPIAGYGPFVMNTREEIISAFADLESGRFGRLQQ